ncbi:hypothetical protein Hanom_Chr06g00551561 [Helianthus anomalus]
MPTISSCTHTHACPVIRPECCWKAIKLVCRRNLCQKKLKCRKSVQTLGRTRRGGDRTRIGWDFGGCNIR